MTMPEILLAIGGALLVTIGGLRVAFCRYAKHTKHLIEQGWKDRWL